MKFSLAVCLLLALPIQASAARLHREHWYQARWCEGRGQTEFRLNDGTRVDCLTDTHAVEFDFADKWAEAIGQSLHYAAMTGKRAGIVLIVEDSKDYKYRARASKIILDFKLPIDLWTTVP